MIRALLRGMGYLLTGCLLLACLALVVVPAHAGISAWRDDIYDGDALVYRISSAAGREGMHTLLAETAGFCLQHLHAGVTGDRCATVLSWVAFQYQRLDRYQEARVLEESVLRFRQQSQDDYPLDTALAAFRLAVTWQELGEENTALSLLEDAWSAAMRHAGDQHPARARILYRQAIGHYYLDNDCRPSGPMLEEVIGLYQQSALTHSPAMLLARNQLALVVADCDADQERALALQKQLLSDARAWLGEHHYYTGLMMVNLATTLVHRDEEAQALTYYRQALGIFEQVLWPEHHDISLPLTGMAGILLHQEHHLEAEAAARRSIGIIRASRGEDAVELIRDLVTMGDVMKARGFYDQALDYFQQAVAIQQQHGLDDHPEAVRQLLGMADIHIRLQRYAEAVPLLEQVMLISRDIPVLPDPYAIYAGSDLADSYAHLGRVEAALELQQVNLQRAESHWGAWHNRTSVAVEQLASLHAAVGHHAKALALYQRALLIHVLNDGLDHENTLITLEHYAEAWLHVRHGRQVAITLMKMGLAQRAALVRRSRLADQAVALQLQAYAAERCRYLASQLWDMGRIEEAREVLDDCKAEVSPGVRYTHAEKLLVRQLDGYFIRLHHQKLKQDALRDAGDATLPAGEEALLQLLLQQSGRAMRDAGAALQQLPALYRSAAGQNESGIHRSMDRRRERSLIEMLGKAGSGVALLQYQWMDDGLLLVMATAGQVQTFRLAISEDRLEAMVSAYLQQLKQRGRATDSLARELYTHLFLPVRAALERQQIHHLLLSLDGILRYLPMAALHDGQHYLLEHYSMSSFHPDSIRMLDRGAALRGTWQVAALGVSEGSGSMPALPHVVQEIRSIMQPWPAGAGMAGHLWLNEDFNPEALRLALLPPYRVLHIASHFLLSPGTEAYSMLLMGKRRFLSLADFRQMDFSGLDMVVLSACETGLPLGGKDSGETMEGLAGLVQQQGARSVVASLWPVADASSALLMRDFYHHLRDAGISKAEALRQAQLALLHDHPDARHPYYWAPFLMVGDWR